MAYEVLSSAYDLLTRDVDYDSIAASIVRLLQKHGVNSGTVLDLACGTGTLSYLLAKEGYEVIGIDSSAEMLSVADFKRDDAGDIDQPIFIMQDMRKLDLFGTVDACICMLDSVNYILEPEDLLKVFRRVHLFLDPGGIFLFDINTPLHFNTVEGKTFCDEDEQAGIFCVWGVAQTDDPNIYQYKVDLFTQNSSNKHTDLWKRESEEQFEYAYEPDLLCEMLSQAGFIDIKLSSSIEGAALSGDERRIYITALKSSV
jgi:SAM-dependent methyltransferase